MRPSTPRPPLASLACVLLSASLAACGGGGGGEIGAPPPFVPDGTFGTSGLVVAQGTSTQTVFVRADAALNGSVALAAKSGGGGTYDGLMVSKRLPDGTPDNTFSGDGQVELPNTHHDPKAVHLSDQDGSILIAADAGYGYSIFKLLANGTLDAGFGSQGVRNVSTAGFMKLAGMVVDPDGRIVVAGTDAGVGYVMRFTSGGDPDPTWNGGTAYTFQLFGSSTYVQGLVRRGGGGYLIAGTRAIAGDTDWLFVGRMGTNGLPVSGFGSAGFLLYTPSFNPEVSGIVARPDGRSVVYGRKNNATPFALGVAANGGLDAQFGFQELPNVQIIRGVGSTRRMSDGEVTLAFADPLSQTVFLWRLLEDGTGDPVFGVDGLHAMPLSPQQLVFKVEPHDASGGFLLLGRRDLLPGSEGIVVHMVEP